VFISKSSLYIFRFEDIVMSVYPNVASLRRKHIDTKEVYQNNDP